MSRKQWGHGYYRGVKSVQATNATLVGLWFHSYDKDGVVNWQGRVVQKLEDGFYLVQLYSWLDGQSTNKKIVHFNVMQDWKFYNTNEDMQFAYEHKYTLEEKGV